jgi:hypothetical protein
MTYEEWSSDPQNVYRLRELVKLTQRSHFISQVMVLSDDHEGTMLRRQLKHMCQMEGIEYNPPRGKMSERPLPVSQGAPFSTELAQLFNLMSKSETGLELNANGLILSGPALDKAIFVYNFWLSMFDGGSREVDFETFVRAYIEFQEGKIVAHRCVNCAGVHYVAAETAVLSCPICRALALPAALKRRNVHRYDAAQPEPLISA